jgi:hypothetical protein
MARSVRPAASTVCRCSVADAVDLLRRADDRERVLDRGPLEQRAVDVEQQQEARRRRSSSAPEVRVRLQPLGEGRDQPCGVLHVVQSWTISTGECM